ncbi:MAG: hypothetical protein IKX31_06365 [Muribaculaceae bacterium]|nr:hypothetical protein [Muribaculaceae bacterium]
MTKEYTLKTIEQSDNVGLYSICINGNESEFEKFMTAFKQNATVSRDYQKIIFAIMKIVSDGALERFFRIEGKYSDNTAALAIDSKRLRLYCLRISNEILILGNGGIKTTATYEEDPILNGYVCDLQAFDSLLKKMQRNGKITIQKNIITNIDNIKMTL